MPPPPGPRPPQHRPHRPHRPSPHGLLRAVPLLGVLLALAVAVASCGDGGSSAGAPAITGAAATRGQAVAEANGCQNCHSTGGGRATGPTWKDLAGSEVELEGGEVVVADDDYLERAIVDPRSEVVDGFPNIMPIYADELSDEQVADLIAYLRELSSTTRGAATTTSTAPAGPTADGG